MRKLTTLLSVMMWVPVAVAQDAPPTTVEGGAVLPDVVGHVGAGYFTTTAPVGARYWFKEGRGIDAGLGLNISKPAVPEGDDAETQTTIGFEFGYLHSLAQSRNLNLFIRPGIGIRHLDDGQQSEFGLNINFSLAGEMFLTGLGLPHVSLTAGMGLGVDIVSPENHDTGFGFSLFHTGASIVTASPLVGVHFYF